MADKPASGKDQKRSGQQQGGNFGQDEAREQQKAESDLSRMGNKSGGSGEKNKQQG